MGPARQAVAHLPRPTLSTRRASRSGWHRRRTVPFPMRRIPRFLMALLVPAAILGAIVSAAGARGASSRLHGHGWPVGEELGFPSPSRRRRRHRRKAGRRRLRSPSGTSDRAPTTRSRAAVVATSRSCPITDDGLTAFVLAPVFGESRRPPAPPRRLAHDALALRRVDAAPSAHEQPGRQLRPLRLPNPYTAYTRADWHPGIGIWQYDSAGLGAPLTTVEAMDAGVVAGEVARRCRVDTAPPPAPTSNKGRGRAPGARLVVEHGGPRHASGSSAR